MTRLLLAAVVVLVAVAAADAIRPDGKEQEAVSAVPGPAAAQTSVQRSSSGYVAVGDFTRKRVLQYDREYLSAEAIDAAFPGAELGEPFDISHLAAAPDGTLALAIYRFPAKNPVEAWVELWRGGRLLGAFQVPAGSFGGGLGFAKEGQLVATLHSDGHSVALFSRAGKRVGSVSATSW
jgi:hypothetical protein